MEWVQNDCITYSKNTNTMAMIKMNPVAATRTAHRVDPFHQLVSDFLGRDMAELSRAPFGGSPQHWPAVNVQEMPEGFALEVAAPGLSREDFQLSLDKNVLTIAYEQHTHKEEEATQSPKYLRREFAQRSFKRAFTLPTSVDATGIDASYNDGILRIELPKKPEEAPKVISIRS